MIFTRHSSHLSICLPIPVQPRIPGGISRLVNGSRSALCFLAHSTNSEAAHNLATTVRIPPIKLQTMNTVYFPVPTLSLLPFL
jgi:hypothetical protein